MSNNTQRNDTDKVRDEEVVRKQCATYLLMANRNDKTFNFCYMFLNFKHIYTGWTIQSDYSSMVPCYRIKYTYKNDIYIYTHKYNSYVKLPHKKMI